MFFSGYLSGFDCKLNMYQVFCHPEPLRPIGSAVLQEKDYKPTNKQTDDENYLIYVQIGIIQQSLKGGMFVI